MGIVKGFQSMSSTDRDILKRKTSVQEIAEDVCDVFSTHAFCSYQIKDAFIFNAKSIALDTYIQRYYEEIDRFKLDHDMKDGQIANRCKRAAAFIIISEDLSLISGLFSIKKLPHKDFPQLFYAHFVFSLCCAFLEIDLINVPKDVERDLIHNLLKERGKSSFAWFMLTMRAFADAYGEKVEPASGDDEV